MNPVDFAGLLKRTMGLDAASIGPSAIERAVQQRMTACRLPDVAAYWERVCTTGVEFQELIEAVVVPETWFFRDREAFRALASVAGEDWLRTHPEGVLRLLSLPCSTGEEPYSMAMALLDAGFPPHRFRIDAVDISSQALAQARRGVFGKNSFRDADLDFRDRHFRAVAGKWELSPAVRQQVQFQSGNLLDGDFLPGTGIYDIIFCRNVLIYFDRSTQDQAVGMLRRLLTARGFLFVGPSETGLLLSHDFDPARLTLAFAFRRAGVMPRPVKLVNAPPPKRISVQHPPPFPVLTSPPVRASIAAPASPKTGLAEANRLADQGHLVEAAQRCEEHLRVHGPSAPALYLLGLVRDAAGNHAAAAAHYRQAVYLDPDHLEALLHLALLREKTGDAAGARVLTERAQRVKPRPSA